ncbi:tubulin polyglutamylase TTLL11 isoform X3 [Patagioenas fasciata]|uniref:tubulin polyglutamylase TTLL11 isoform X3 n=1 Tax=Patagioenas fasciata TaxID=372321 RepID=UPI003A993950
MHQRSSFKERAQLCPPPLAWWESREEGADGGNVRRFLEVCFSISEFLTPALQFPCSTWPQTFCKVTRAKHKNRVTPRLPRCQAPERGPEEPLPAGPAALPSLCLKQVFPKYAKQFSYLRLLDRVAALFIRFLGVKGTTKLGPTGFRTFIRNCKLSNSNFSMASVDILYIDITRRWNSMGIDHKESGMCLQAFVEAFFCLAQKKYKSLPLHEQVASLIDFCEYHLAALDEKRLVCGRGVVERRSAVVPCQTDGPHLAPAAHSPLLNRMATAGKYADDRNQRYERC